ncbi:MAG: AraC family transcriptional regulator [Ruminococcaceae bacterium]|nr:AraC family transcriptional regulator [Oscillospiraceae bacterium]
MRNEVFKENRNVANKQRVENNIFMIDNDRADYTYDDSFPFHYHDWYELYTLKEGTCIYRIEKKEYVLKKGDWIFVPAGIFHKVFYTESPHERTLIYFSKEYITPSLIKHLSKFSVNPVYTPEKNDDAYIHDVIEKLFNEYSTPDEFSEILYRNLLYELLVFFLRKPSFKNGEAGIDLIIAHVVEYIEHNYTQNLTLEKLADISNVSVSYLSRKFKQIMGVGVSEYIQLVRLNNAKNLLIQTNESILRISNKCGFNDSNYFSYIFKKKEGVSPLKYRKKYL